MMLSEVTPVPEAVLPQEAFKAHLRLGTGFDEAGLQDAVLISFLRAAIAAIEARTGKVLLARDFLMSVTAWRDPQVQALPLAPVQLIQSVIIVAASGDENLLDSARYHLEPDSQQPRLRPVGGALPAIETGGDARILMRAGMANSWSALPGDLAQAVLMLAAHYYEFRDDTRLQGGCMPFGVTSLIERYRALRVSLGVGGGYGMGLGRKLGPGAGA
ncbi:head-tail connector protein [Phaeobacter sp. C3_T13_0]|uniref:head-tail connector protein n=1 Tax=Phaeobacter cretensis TaxID=3342641 RepID=UPI0039BC52E2